MPLASLLFAAFAAFLVSTATTRWLTRPSAKLRLLDLPNERSLHRIPVPRTGGLGILAGIVLGLGLLAATLVNFGPSSWRAGMAGMATALVAMVSFLDDRGSLPVIVRLVTHFVSSLLLVVALFAPIESCLVTPLTLRAAVGGAIAILLSVWMINLYNFMDGMDGFAGGMAVIGFGAFAVLGWMAGHAAFAGVSLVVMSAAGGFLLSNFPPARIFMGDTGSSTIGLLAATLISWSARDTIFPVWAGILVFSPFIVDATVTLIRRALRRDKIWLAHKTHYYQRLVQLGWGHKKTVVREYVLMFLCALTAVLGVRQSPIVQFGIVVGWLAIYAALIWLIEEMERRAGVASTAR